MANTDAKSILALSGVDAGFAANQFMSNLIMIGLLRKLVLLNNPMAATDAKSILANSGCDACYGDRLGLIIIGLLRQLVDSGGGGGGVTSGTGAPTSTPPTGSGLYIQTDSVPQPGIIWEYYNGAWH